MEGMDSCFEAEGYRIYEIFKGDTIAKSELTVSFGDKGFKVSVVPPKNRYTSPDFSYSPI